MDRNNHYYKQHEDTVSLNAFYDDWELHFSRIVRELIGVGIKVGGIATQHIVPDTSIDISPLLTGYDLTGRRLVCSTTARINIVPTLAVPTFDGYTQVGNDGSSFPYGLTGNANNIQLPNTYTKWLTVSIYFDRVQTDQRIDGNGNIVFYRLLDSFKFRLIQGIEAAIPVRPTLPSDGSLCVCDILLKNPTLMSYITNADIYYDRKNTFTPV